LLCRAVLPLYLALLFDRPVMIPGQLQWALSECARHCDLVVTGLGGFSSAQIMNKILHVPFFVVVGGVVASSRYLDQGILINE
jgi:hypothetical protein